MEISEKMNEALNDQLNKELYSAYLYLSMAAWAESNNLNGFAHWFKVQAKEELGHAMKFYSFIFERGGKVFLKDVSKPKTDWSSPVEVFEDTLEHEKYITKSIHEILKLAREEGDYSTEVFLHWFIDEQVEEEDQARKILDTLRMIGDNKAALFAIDRELVKRKE